MSIIRARHFARLDIDRAAGEARKRYITDLPHQERVYQRKLQQAHEYLVGVAGNANHTVPRYVAGEARATGSTPTQAAQRIVAAATHWDDVICPALEEARTAGKHAIASASSETIDAVLAAALAELAAL